LVRAYKTGNISETVEDRAKITINGLYTYTGFRLPPKCMTLNDLWARLKVIDSLNAAKMAKYSLVMTSRHVEWLDAYLLGVRIHVLVHLLTYLYSWLGAYKTANISEMVEVWR